MKLRSALILNMGIVMLFFCSCKGINSSEVPEVRTLEIFDIRETSAKSGGEITSNLSSAVIDKGICWDRQENPTISDNYISSGPGSSPWSNTLTGLNPDAEYHVRAYATTDHGVGYGENLAFKTISSASSTQIIADHSVVDKFDDIPQEYIDKVKEMWVVVAGESHSQAYRTGLLLLESLNSKYSVSVVEGGTPEGYTTANLRASRATWGDYGTASGWIYNYGEEDWFTNSTAIARTKAGIAYCNTHNLSIAAIGFGWCWDHIDYTPSSTYDPVYGCRWWGTSNNGPEGARAWGLDAGDYSITGNSVSLDTYLSVTQSYIDYCSANGYSTKVFFTTAPVDGRYATGESGYQGWLKMERIRDYVRQDNSRILFDYADILCYDDNGAGTTTTWNGHTYPVITPTNLGDGTIGHIGSAGALRLGKAMWWMLARIAGWNG